MKRLIPILVLLVIAAVWRRPLTAAAVDRLTKWTGTWVGAPS